MFPKLFVSQPESPGMGADLHFISQWEMSKISFLEGQGETGSLIAQPPELQIELAGSWTLLARLCVPPLLNCPKGESIKFQIQLR